MVDEDLRVQVRSQVPHMRIAALLWIVAMMIIATAAVVWIVIAVMTGDFFSNSKAVRDAAEPGSSILSQEGSIHALEAWVLPLAFVGIATFIAGFGFAFSNILRSIRLRAGTLAEVLPVLKQRGSVEAGG